MSNLISNSVQLPANVTPAELADYSEQIKWLRGSGIWTRLIWPALEAQRRAALGIVRAHASADANVGATTSYNNGLLDGIEAALELYDLDRKVTAKAEALAHRG